MAFSPDGSRLATGSATAIYLWETRSSYDPRVLALVPSRSVLEEPVLSIDAVKRITHDSTLPPDVRDAAVRLVEAQGDDPAHLNTKSFDLVKSPGGNRSAYELAVRRAATAVRLAPWNAAYANTLALALYRAGRYQEALDTVHRTSGLRPRPSSFDTAISVLARLRLGQLDAARADLVRLTRETVADDLKALIAEAKALSENLARRH